MMQKIWDYSLKIFLTVSAIFYVATPRVTAPEMAVSFGYFSQEMFFIYGTVVLFCLGMMKKQERTLTIKSLPGLVLFVLFTSLLFGFGDDLRIKTMNLFIGLVLFKTIFEHFKFLHFKSYAWWFGCLLLLNLMMCVLQYNGVPMLYQAVAPQLTSRMDSVIGFMKLKVHLGVLSGLLMPMVVMYAPVFSICLVPLVFFSQSSVAMVSIVISGLLLSWFKCRRFFLPILVLLSVAGSLYVLKYDMPGGQFGERFKVWRTATDHVLKASPVLGEGIGSFAKTNFASKQVGLSEVLHWQWAHNEFVQAFFELGVIGISLIICFLLGLKDEFIKFKEDGVLQTLFITCLAICALSFFHFPFHVGRFAGLCVFFFAIFSARIEDLKT